MNFFLGKSKRKSINSLQGLHGYWQRIGNVDPMYWQRIRNVDPMVELYNSRN